jgi:hypothetical protein
MSSNYGMDQSWDLQSQFPHGQRIQLEEEYYKQDQGQDHPQHLVHLHAASYPPAATQRPGTYYNAYPPNYSQDPAGQQSVRSQSYSNDGVNLQGSSHNSQSAYGTPISQSHEAPFHPTPIANNNGFYAHAPFPYRQPFVQGSSSPASVSVTTLPDRVIGSEGEGGITPPFSSSPMSLPLTFESKLSHGQSPYQQQPPQLHIRSSSGSNSPNSLVYEQEHARHGKRQRGVEDDDEYGLDVGMEPESEGQDGKETKAKPRVCYHCLVRFR